MRGDALALKGCNGTDEDVLTYAMFPQVAPKFFVPATRVRRTWAKIRRRSEGSRGPAATPAKPASQMHGVVNYVITLDGKTHAVTVAPAEK